MSPVEMAIEFFGEFPPETKLPCVPVTIGFYPQERNAPHSGQAGEALVKQTPLFKGVRHE